MTIYEEALEACLSQIFLKAIFKWMMKAAVATGAEERNRAKMGYIADVALLIMSARFGSNT